jgi:WD40 repeat protein
LLKLLPQVTTIEGLLHHRVQLQNRVALIMTLPASISTPSACLALSPDGSTVACARGSVLQVFSVSSCQLLQEIQCHTDSITAVRYVGSSLLSVGMDGLVCIWDDTMGSSAPQTFRLHHPVLSSFACGRRDAIFLVVAKKFEAGSSIPAACAVYSLNVNKGGVVRKLFKCRGACEIHGSSDGSLLGITNRRRIIAVDSKGDVLARGSHTRTLSTLVCDRSGKFLVAGDDRGELITFTLNGAVLQPSSGRMHWHAHTVSSLCLNQDCTQLFSTGEEGVLVVWQLHSLQRNFLPRLGAAVTCMDSIPSGAVAVLLSDASIRVIDPSSLTVTATIRRIYEGAVQQGASLCFFDASRGAVVLPGSGGTLQWFDVLHHSHIMGVDILPRNVYSRTERRALPQKQLTDCVWDSSGRSMATCERSSADVKCGLGEGRLRFWHWQAGSFVLNSVADLPPSQKVLCCAMGGSGHVFILGCTNGRFAVWRPDHPAGNGTGSKSWRCEAAVPWRREGVGAVAISPDESVFAASFGSVVSLWSADSLNLLHSTVAAPQSREAVTHLAFVSSNPRFLVAGSSKRLIVIDAVSKDTVFSLSCRVSCISSHSRSPIFCVAIPQKSASPCSVLFQFSHNASTLRWEPSGAHVIGGCVTSIVCNRSTHEFIPVLDHSRPVPLHAIARPVTSSDGEFGDSLPAKSAFEAIYGGVVATPGESAVEGSDMDTVKNGFNRGENFLSAFSAFSLFSPNFVATFCIDAPTHLLPPPSKLLAKVRALIAATQSTAAR